MNPTSLLDHRQTASTNLPTTADKAAMKLNNARSIYLFLMVVVTVLAMELDPKCKCSFCSNKAPLPLPAESVVFY